MPYQSYRTREVALDNATRFMQDVGADAIKIQGGKTVTHIINALANVSIPCFSHVGLVPHHFALLGGFKVQGRNADDALRIYQDALAIQEAGAVGVEIEAVPPQVAECITKKVDIITFGIGAGLGCDGQILLGLDMLGFFDAFKPKFVKRYANLAQLSIQAIATYVDEVKTAKFPGREHTYSMDASEEGKFLDLL
jgi:3-methyl-2-oxobutanoate hydroxymethyltransferase